MKGDFDFAISLINEKLEDFTIDENMKSQLKLQKLIILTRKGIYTEVVTKIGQIKQEITSAESSQLLFNCILIEFNAQIRLLENEKCHDLLKQAETVYKLIKSQDSEFLGFQADLIQMEAIYERYFGTLEKSEKLYLEAISKRSIIKFDYNNGEAWNHLGIIYDQKGNFEKSLDAYINSLNIYDHFNDEISSIGVATNMGLIYWQEGKLRLAIQVNSKGLDIARKTNNSRALTPLLLNNGLINIDLGKLDEALLNFEESLSNAKIIGHQKGVLLSHMNSGIIYDMKSEYDLAINHFKKSIKIAKEINDDIDLIRLYNNIANSYRNKGENKNAISFLDNSLAKHSNVENPILLSKTLFELIVTHLSDFQITKSKKFQKQLRELSAISENNSINILYRLSQAITLKEESGLLNRAKAFQLFNEILDEEELTYYVAMTSILNSCEILITEVRATQNEMDMQKIELLINKLEELSNHNPSIKVQIDILILKSRISFIFDNFDEAFELLETGKSLSQENDHHYLHNVVEAEKTYIEDMVIKMTEVGESTTAKFKLDDKRNIDYIEFLKRNFKGLSL